MKYSAKTALLGGIIDYAGTFPPAALALGEALKHACEFRRQGRHPWLMGKVAITLADLKKVNNRLLYESGADGAAWIFTALGSTVSGDELSDLVKTIEWDVREIQHWEERARESSLRQAVVGYETKLPLSVGQDNAVDFLGRTLDRFEAVTRGRITPFFEVSLEGEWLPRLHAVGTALSDWMDEHADSPVVPGIKVRTGGQLVPTSGQLAEAIVTCTSRGLRFKATQGLHEAVTHGTSYGFVNLFGALALAQSLGAEGFEKKQIEDCLTCEDPKQFAFEEGAFSFKKYRLESDAIEAARRIHGATFGSCSVDEPDESLAKTFV